MSIPFSIQRSSPEQRTDALRVLHQGLPPDQQIGLLQALQATTGQGEGLFDGLFVASDGTKIENAAWCQLAPGRTACMWLPNDQLVGAIELMKVAADFLDQRRITVAQFLAAADDTLSQELLFAADFHKLARLAYLWVDCERFSSQKPTSRLQFESQAYNQPKRLGKLFLQTYEDSLDCPQLNGVRSPAEVIESYAQQGDFSPDRWFFVRRDGRDIGALILAAHLETHNWELAYMGLVPTARGQGFGRDVLNYAIWYAKSRHAQRFVLAVDEANQPAVDTYSGAGFEAWDHRTVFARLRPRE